VKVSELFEQHDTSSKNRSWYYGGEYDEWKQDATSAGLAVVKGDDEDRAEGRDGLVGEWDHGTDKGWLVKKANKRLNKELTIKEDWGSSDWYPVMRAMETYMANGYSMEEAARRCADTWYQAMGWEDAEQAELNIIARFKRLQQNRPKHEPKATDNPTYRKVSEGMFVVKNKDGKEKRFKDDNSAEAKAWKQSSTKKSSVKLAAYSQAYWEYKEQNATSSIVLPWDKIDPTEIGDQFDRISAEQGFGRMDDFTVLGQSFGEVDGVKVRKVKVRMVFSFGKEDDLGLDVKNDERISDVQTITLRRDTINPKKLVFAGYSS